MSKQEKRLDRLFSTPNDYTMDELDTLLKSLGYVEVGKTSGSSIKYYNQETKDIINFHRPHPGNLIKRYIQEEIIEKLKRNGCRKDDEIDEGRGTEI